MNEIWRDIPGYGGIYRVSNLGQVMSTAHPNDSRKRKNTLLKQMPNSKGYLRVRLIALNGAIKSAFVHRLVAEAFINKPSGCDIVNHLDFNPKNNKANNLEWVTRKGNYDYSAQRGRFDRTPEWLRKTKKSLDEKMGRPVIGESIETGEKVYFKALNDVRGAGFQPSCVCVCCKGRRAAHGGYIWRYADAQTD